MKYLSIDIETTGLDFRHNQMIEFGCVADNLMYPEVPVNDLPSLRILLPRRDYNINVQCMKMHSKLFNEMEAVDWNKLDNVDFYRDDDKWFANHDGFEYLFRSWLDEFGFKGKLNVAGKNFQALDLPFIKKHVTRIKFHHRVLDPAILFLKKTDQQLPNLELCCARAGIELKDYHTAVGDAKTVVELIRCGLAA